MRREASGVKPASRNTESGRQISSIISGERKGRDIRLFGDFLDVSFEFQIVEIQLSFEDVNAPKGKQACLSAGIPAKASRLPGVFRPFIRSMLHSEWLLPGVLPLSVQSRSGSCGTARHARLILNQEGNSEYPVPGPEHQPFPRVLENHVKNKL